MALRPGTLESLVMNAGFWRGKKVLITGHTGFKGGWLSLWLQRLGADLLGYSLPPTTPSLFETARVVGGMSSVMGDIRDLERLREMVVGHGPEIVIHMAAQSLVRYSYQNPVETYATNVMGTVNLLEAVRQVPGARVVINVTSDKCYRNDESPEGYREEQALGGRDPYSSSKACSELVTAAYRSSFFADRRTEGGPVAIATVRSGNVIGGGDWAADRLVPDCIRAFVVGRPVSLRYPNAVRPWQHVLEPLRGYLMLAERLWGEGGAAYAESWNFGPDLSDDASVGSVAARVAALWGSDARVSQPVHDAFPHEAGVLRLDATKARTRLGWRPRWRLNQALAHTVAWYRAGETGQDMQAFTLSQIESYSHEPNE